MLFWEFISLLGVMPGTCRANGGFLFDTSPVRQTSLPDKHIFAHLLPSDVWLGLGHATNIIP